MIWPRWLLNRKRGPNHHAWTKRGPNVHSRFTRDEIGHVRKKHQSRFWHRVVAQADWPHQSQQTQGDAIERSHHQTPDIQRKGDWRQATLAPFPEREEREQRPAWRSSFRRMGTGSDDYIRRMPILRALHRRLLQTHLDVPHAAKEWSVRKLPKSQDASWKINRLPTIEWGK